MKRVLAFVDFDFDWDQGKLEGMEEVARARRWRFIAMHSRRSGDSASRIVASMAPDGIIAQGFWPSTDGNRPPAWAWRGLPCVYLDGPGGAACSVSTDSAAVARMALAELAKIGPATIVFATNSPGAVWSRRRRDAARDYASHGGIGFIGLDLTDKADVAGAAAALAGAARPVAVFAANDESAVEIYPHIAMAGLEFGKSVVAVGSDNIAPICESLSPRLSSVQLGHFEVGLDAALMLARLMDGGTGGRTLIGPIGLRRRASSILALPESALLHAARAFIADHALDGIGVADVAAACGVSRRTLEAYFRAKTGATVHSAIADRRFAKVEEMLSGRRQAIEPIANLCGWKSAAHLKRAFKARYGMTMREFRERQGN